MKDEQREFLFLLQSSLVRSPGYKQLQVITSGRISHQMSMLQNNLKSSVCTVLFLGLGKVSWPFCSQLAKNYRRVPIYFRYIYSLRISIYQHSYGTAITNTNTNLPPKFIHRDNSKTVENRDPEQKCQFHQATLPNSGSLNFHSFLHLSTQGVEILGLALSVMLTKIVHMHDHNTIVPLWRARNVRVFSLGVLRSDNNYACENKTS